MLAHSTSSRIPIRGLPVRLDHHPMVSIAARALSAELVAVVTVPTSIYP